MEPGANTGCSDHLPTANGVDSALCTGYSFGTASGVSVAGCCPAAVSWSDHPEEDLPLS